MNTHPMSRTKTNTTTRKLLSTPMFYVLIVFSSQMDDSPRVINETNCFLLFRYQRILRICKIAGLCERWTLCTAWHLSQRIRRRLTLCSMHTSICWNAKSSISRRTCFIIQRNISMNIVRFVGWLNTDSPNQINSLSLYVERKVRARFECEMCLFRFSMAHPYLHCFRNNHIVPSTISIRLCMFCFVK